MRARALGVGLETVADMRALLRRTHELTRYEPIVSADWDRLETQLTGAQGGPADVQSARSGSRAETS